MNRLLAFLIALVVAVSASAQTRPVRGRIIDASDRQPLPGVAIVVKGSTTGTNSDKAGRFTLNVPKGDVTLIASFIGYVAQQIVVKVNQDSVTISLKPDAKALNEVVITGYSSMHRRAMPSRVLPAPMRPVRSSGRPVLYKQPQPEQQAGQLTAGEIHDYSKWTLWQDIDKTDLRDYRKLWRQAPTERYSVQLVTPDGFPVIDVPVRLLDSQQQVLWQTRTDNTGRGELWRSDGPVNLFRTANDSILVTRERLAIEATVGGKTYLLNKPKPFGKGNNSLTVKQTCRGAASAVDVAFVVDATGSMGDEIAYLKAELTDVISRAQQAVPNSTLRLASVFYRDVADEYLTRYRDFDNQPDSAVSFIKQQSAAGGGDFPEAVDTALSVALTKLSWSQTAKARLLFVVLDAPPHDDPKSVASLQRSVAKAAAMGVRLIPVAASGIDKSTEYLLRAMALGTNGTYVFLTDDSGIGNPHIKPTTDQYTVEKLNALLLRLIIKFTQTPDCQTLTTVNNVPSTVIANVPELSPPTDTTARPDLPSFRYFPNPTRDYLTIENAKPIDELYVMDITGKVLMRETPTQAGRAATTVRLDMQPYPTGTYLFRFTAAGTPQSGRFLLNR